MDFYSHWEPHRILLKEHLKEVGDKSKRIVISKEFSGLDKEILANISYLIGISHDFGKFTTFFQEKLKKLRHREDPIARHGLISALFAFEIIGNFLEIKNLTQKIPFQFLPLIAYFVVKHHHSDLTNIEEDVKTESLWDSRFKDVKDQLSDIEKNRKAVEDIYKILFAGYNLSVTEVFERVDKYKTAVRCSKDIGQLIMEIDRSSYSLKKSQKSQKNRNIIYYLLTQFFYSVLIDSDKKHAANTREINRSELNEISPDIIKTYLNSPAFRDINDSSINCIRDKIRKSIEKNITSVNLSQKIFTLTAPTGTGKTLSSFMAALILRKRLKESLNTPEPPRIIYSLPFTSIIEQNFKVFAEVLEKIDDFKVKESQYLLKHHYLSDIFYKTEGIDKEEDIDDSLALIESWESEVIVTTFIQLFHTLIGYKNRTLKKFHNIANSIILLDEVQNIPTKYWRLVREILIAMANYFNCRIILMTATKPLIFNEGEYKELVDNSENYFKDETLNRVCLRIDNEEKTINDFCNELVDMDKNSYLFVFNTISSSLDFYNKITNRIHKSGLNFRICYLSTNIIPKHRSCRIQKIKDSLNDNERIIVVSTQLIEAGIDIDCECVYRDLGPLDSIIQVAGRCNRNRKSEKQGDVHILNLIKEDNNSRFTNIYGHFLIKVVRNIIGKYRSVAEKGFFKLISSYFKEIKGENDSVEEEKIINAIYDLYYYDNSADITKRVPISHFQLIEEKDYYKIDVFVEVDYEAERVWQRYKTLISAKELAPFERKKEFLKIKKQFYDFVISIPNKYKNELTSFEDKSELGYISKQDLKALYSLETGFKRDSVSSGTLIC